MTDRVVPSRPVRGVLVTAVAVGLVAFVVLLLAVGRSQAAAGLGALGAGVAVAVYLWLRPGDDGSGPARG